LTGECGALEIYVDLIYANTKVFAKKFEGDEVWVYHVEKDILHDFSLVDPNHDRKDDHCHGGPEQAPAEFF
jgi:hypothetical protein